MTMTYACYGDGNFAIGFTRIYSPKNIFTSMSYSATLALTFPKSTNREFSVTKTTHP